MTEQREAQLRGGPLDGFSFPCTKEVDKLVLVVGGRVHRYECDAIEGHVHIMRETNNAAEFDAELKEAL